jgi:lysophospholipase L1-like esterase
MQSVDRHLPMAFAVVTGFLAIVVAGLLSVGLMHISSSPDVLGRYSVAYASFLLLLFLLLAALVWALWRAPRWLVAALTNSYLFVGSLLLSLFVVEVMLRVINPLGMDFFHWLPYHMQGMIDDPDMGYVHPRSISYFLGKNRVTLNSHGLRGKETSYPKPIGKKRVLVLGDSVTFGWGVSDGETFPEKMEPLLVSATGESWEVINSGVNGYNTQQEEAYFRREGIRYDPDVVVLVYVSNDTEPIIHPNETTWRRYPSWPSSLPEAFDRLRALSFTYQAAQMFLRAQQLHAFRTGAQKVESLPVTATPGWPASRDYLRRIAERCAMQHTQFIVAKFGIDDPVFDSQLQALGIATVSLDRANEKVSPDEYYVSAVDPHPTASLHKAIAEVLVEELSRRGMLNDHM